MQGTDLLYLGRSPYGVNDDFGITWTNVLASITAGGAGGSNTQIQYNNSGALAGDTGFTTDGAGNETIVGSLKVDNLELNGNTISSLDTDGDINIIPNGFGDVNLLHDGSAISGAEQSLNISQTNTSVTCRLASFKNNNIGAALQFIKSRNTTVGSYTDVQSGDSMGDIFWYASANSTLQFASRISSIVDAAPSGTIIPSRLDFATTNVNSGLQQVSLTIDRNNYVSTLYNVYAQNLVPSISNIVSAAGNTVLTRDSTQVQQITGSTTQTITMPVVTTLQPLSAGQPTAQTWTIINNSSGIVTVNSSGANLILSMASNTTAIITNILTTGTTAASWNASYITDTGASGIVSPGTINQLAFYATTSSTVSGLTPGSGVLTFLQTPTSANLASAVTDESGTGSLVFCSSPNPTYVPVITFGGASVGITYGLQTGSYTVTGRICTVTASVTLTSKGSSTGAAAISLPVASRASSAQIVGIAASGVTYVGSIYSQINSATSVALINTQVSAGALASITDTGFSNTSSVTITVTYLV